MLTFHKILTIILYLIIHDITDTPHCKTDTNIYEYIRYCIMHFTGYLWVEGGSAVYTLTLILFEWPLYAWCMLAGIIFSIKTISLYFALFSEVNGNFWFPKKILKKNTVCHELQWHKKCNKYSSNWRFWWWGRRCPMEMNIYKIVIILMKWNCILIMYYTPRERKTLIISWYQELRVTLWREIASYQLHVLGTSIYTTYIYTT